jgi:hypothetical protein
MVWVCDKYFGLQDNFQLINLECETGIYELASVCDVKGDGHQVPVPITFAPVKSDTEVS